MIIVQVLASIALGVLAAFLILAARRAAAASWSFVRDFFSSAARRARQAIRTDVATAIARMLPLWLREQLVVDVVGTPPGDILMARFPPGVQVDVQTMIEAKLALDAILERARGRRARPLEGPLVVVADEDLEVDVIRRVLVEFCGPRVDGNDGALRFLAWREGASPEWSRQ